MKKFPSFPLKCAHEFAHAGGKRKGEISGFFHGEATQNRWRWHRAGHSCQHRFALAPGQNHLSQPLLCLPSTAPTPAPTPGIYFAAGAFLKAAFLPEPQLQQVPVSPGRLLTRVCPFAQLFPIPALKSPLSVFLADGLGTGFQGVREAERVRWQVQGSIRKVPALPSAPVGASKQSCLEIRAEESPGKARQGCGTASRTHSLMQCCSGLGLTLLITITVKFCYPQRGFK